MRGVLMQTGPEDRGRRSRSCPGVEIEKGFATALNGLGMDTLLVSMRFGAKRLIIGVDALRCSLGSLPPASSNRAFAASTFSLEILMEEPAPVWKILPPDRSTGPGRVAAKAARSAEAQCPLPPSSPSSFLLAASFAGSIVMDIPAPVLKMLPDDAGGAGTALGKPLGVPVCSPARSNRWAATFSGSMASFLPAPVLKILPPAGRMVGEAPSRSLFAAAIRCGSTGMATPLPVWKIEPPSDGGS